MRVRIAGEAEEATITPDDVEGEVRWISPNCCEGILLDGRPFRCATTPIQWEQFLVS